MTTYKEPETMHDWPYQVTLKHKDIDKRLSDQKLSEADLLPKEDVVNSPKHYTVGGHESIDVIKAKLTPEEYRGFLKGNVMKYLHRANYKGKHKQDIGKAAFYLNKLVESSDD